MDDYPEKMYRFQQEINHLLNLTSIVFVIGLVGIVLNWKNLLIILMSIELLLLSVNLNFVAFSVMHDNVIGQIFVLFVLACIYSPKAT